MNAIDLLIDDHEKVKDILTRMTESTERAVKTRAELLQKLEMEVSIHTQLEEQILYPAFKEAGGKEELKMFHEAKEEHRAVDSLVLPDLKSTDPASVQFSGVDGTALTRAPPVQGVTDSASLFFPAAMR